MIDYLVFAAHPDDAELGMGGTIIKAVQQGKKVVVVDLTQGELGSRGDQNTRRLEAQKASEIMGLHQRVNLGFADGFFEIDEKSIRLLVAQIRRFRPHTVFANVPSDRHPDHGRAARLVKEACFYAGLVKIETEWEGSLQVAHRPQQVFHYIQDHFHQPDFVVDITAQAEQKMQAILAYETQFYQADQQGVKTPISGKDFLDFLRGRMYEMGRTIGVQCGEGFLSDAPLAMDLP